MEIKIGSLTVSTSSGGSIDGPTLDKLVASVLDQISRALADEARRRRESSLTPPD